MLGHLNHKYRYVVLAAAFFSLTCTASNYIIIHFTFICMNEDPSGIRSNGNESYNVFSYTQQEKSYLIGVVGLGTAVGTFPINHLSIKYGARIPFFISALISALATLLIPFAAEIGLLPLLICRFVQGMAYAADFATMGVICARWAPISEYATFVAFLTLFTPISTFLTNYGTSLFCTSSFGWRMSFYVHAVVCVISSFVWLHFYSNDPSQDKRVFPEELALIHEGKTKQHIIGATSVPYKKILKNTTILVVWFNTFVDIVTVMLLLSYAPSYFRAVLGFDVQMTGLLTALCGITQLPFKIASAIASDKIRFVSEKSKMIFFNTLAVGVCGVICGSIGFFSREEKWWSFGCVLAITTIMVTNCGGFYKCGCFVARQYSHIVIATIQFMKCVALLVGPTIVYFCVASDDDLRGWRTVFLINASMMIIGNVLFWIVCTDQPADFTKEPSNEEAVELKGK